MEFTEYIRLLRKWFWLLLICGFIAGGISFIVNTGRPPIYSASTTISIGRYIDAPNPNTSDIATGISLAQTYAQLIRTNDVLQGTIDALNLTLSPQQLESLFTTNILSGTSLLVVTVQYIDPILAADIANTLAQQLIQRSPSNLTSAQQTQIDYAETQMEALDNQLQEQRQSLASINSQLADTTDPQEISRLTDLRTSLTEQITQAAVAIAQFQSTISSIQQRTNALDIVERATIPTFPLGSSSLVGVILGALIGLTVAVGIALLVEYLDDRVKTTEIAAQVLELPVLGAIPRFGKKKAAYAERVIRKEDSLTPIAEAYRRLQTNLTFASNGHKSIYVITSPGPGEGKSVTAANLAATMANDGTQVLLIDADLRRPRQHEIFGLENQTGLSTLLIADSETKVKSESEQEKQMLTHLNECIQSTASPNLKVITSGFTPSNPTQVLRSSLMKRWIDAFRTARDIDVIVIDSPPALLFGDSAILAVVAEADTVLVIDSQHTRVKAAQETKAQLLQLGVTIKGVILNQINPRDEEGRYGYGYGYGYGYYYSEQASERTQMKRGIRDLLPWK